MTYNYPFSNNTTRFKMNEELEKLILSGGDERLDILGSGQNKYHLNPLQFKDLLHRGSCTCNTLNEISYEALAKKFQDPDVDYIEVRENQTRRLKTLLNFEGKDEFDIVYAPSGSDLPYIPLIFSKLLSPQKDIKLLLTCPEELGSGTQLAFLGKYYAAKNQFGNSQEKGDDINSHYNISMERFAARNDDGKILNHVEDINRIINNNEKHALIGALVIGSKSGIEDDISLIPKIDPNVMWVVDLCQFRNSKKLVNELLDKNCMVMITGSKFYMSPPFSGAMLIPKRMSQKLGSIKVDEKILKGYTDIFTAYDFPKTLSNIGSGLNKIINKSVILRWEAALAMMDNFDELPREHSIDIIQTWNIKVKSRIQQSTNLELMPQQDKTNKSIISFKVKSKDGEYLNYQTLRSLHKALSEISFLSNRFKKVFIGQPVKYGYGAFLRVALGAFNVINLLDVDESIRYDVDMDLIDHINKLSLDFENSK